jgi:two-component system, chemotaxis family, response regulator Rcp1
MIRIMLVEDNSADARLTKEVLKDTGLEHELIWINEGKKALDQIASDRDLDLFILDLNLPKASGREILTALRNIDRYRLTPVIVMTGSIAPGDKVIVEGDCFVNYMVKPMTIDEIDKTVETIKELLTAQGK